MLFIIHALFTTEVCLIQQIKISEAVSTAISATNQAIQQGMVCSLLNFTFF